MSALTFARVLRPEIGFFATRAKPFNRGLVSKQWRYNAHRSRSMSSWTLTCAGVATAGIGLHAINSPTINCEPPAAPKHPAPHQLPPPPQSAVNLYELTFGSVCGICAGVFIKKGAKAIAFIVGGVFVLLQYLGSISVIRIDWANAASRFENLLYRTEGGVRRPPSIGSLWRWLVDFLTADFQPRASFIAGLALGIRIG